MAKYKDVTNAPLPINGDQIFQRDLEYNFPILLKDTPKKDGTINVVVVGAWHGDEILSFLKWPSSRIFAFEPNREDFGYLRNAYKNNERVICFNVACGDTDGTATLFHSSVTGNDSILPPQEREGFKLVGTREVKTMRLDSVPELSNLEIDLLWIDVQGFEKYVLAGATETLKRTKAAFVELNDDDHAYKGATRVAELVSLFEKSGFNMAYKEFDETLKSGTGIFLRNDIKTSFFDQENIDARSRKLVRDISRHHLLVKMKAYKIFSKILPTSIKIKLKSLLARLDIS